MKKPTDISFLYFAGEPLGVPVLGTLLNAGLRPRGVVCNPDRQSGRGQKLTPPPVKVLAAEHGIPVFQPETLSEADPLFSATDDLYVVVAYNKILPRWLITRPHHGTINLHPSLLPFLRGASPIRSAILRDQPEAVGVSVIVLDEQMDHGPLLAQEAVALPDEAWPPRGTDLDATLAAAGGALLAETVSQWVNGEIAPQEQDHEAATYCGRLVKEMGRLELDPAALPRGSAARETLLKIRAFDGFPGTFFIHEGARIKITEAHVEDDQIVIDRIIPEGRREMAWSAYIA